MIVDRSGVEAIIVHFVATSPLNRVRERDALRPDLAGMEMFAPPLVGIASADDPLFDALGKPGVIGPQFRPPGQWLPGARSVVSFFLPFTEQVVVSNRRERDWPSYEWLHARIEGQTLIDALHAHLVEELAARGVGAVAPGVHADFRTWRDNAPAPDSGKYASNWSERHVAHIAGLGTFGLSAGIITEKGMAGRLGSIVTDLPLPANARPYARFDEYCTHCGACEARCPVGAVSATRGRDKAACSRFLDLVLERHSPRYGCGKYQVGVPCERRIPARRG